MANFKPNPPFGRTFIKEWRKYRNLTQEQLAERIGMTAASLSRMERGLQPYSQGILENLADKLSCEAGDILMRNPLEEADPRVIDLIAALDAQEQAQVRGYIEALVQRRAA